MSLAQLLTAPAPHFANLLAQSVALHVSGNQLVNDSGQAVVLRGVNASGSLESYPTGLAQDANGNYAAPAQVVDEAITGWHANLVRVTVSEQFWFGQDQMFDGSQNQGPGVAADGGESYRQLVDDIVNTAARDGAHVMLSLWGTEMDQPGLTPFQHDMPDDTAAVFWQSAAARYANNPNVMFDLAPRSSGKEDSLAARNLSLEPCG